MCLSMRRSGMPSPIQSIIGPAPRIYKICFKNLRPCYKLSLSFDPSLARSGEAVSTVPADEESQDYAAPCSGYWESPLDKFPYRKVSQHPLSFLKVSPTFILFLFNQGDWDWDETSYTNGWEWQGALLEILRLLQTPQSVWSC